MTFFHRFAALGAALLVFGQSAAFADTPAAKVSVELSRASDDGLTVRFADALGAAFNASPGFAAGPQGQADVAVVVTGTVQGASGEHGPFSYSVRITGRGLAPTVLSGNCYEDAMADCADYIIVKSYGAGRHAAPLESLPK